MSANGFTLTVRTIGGGSFKLRASWPAPFFVLAGLDTNTPDEQPLLYHADSLADAQRFAGRSGRILDAQFVEVAS